MSLEKFASRGLKAQAGIGRFIADHKKISPAPILAGASPGTSAGEPATTRPRSPLTQKEEGAMEAEAGIRHLTQPSPRSSGGEGKRPAPGGMLARVQASGDVSWLKSVMCSRDYQLAIRTAAQRRLGALVRKPRL